MIALVAVVAVSLVTSAAGGPRAWSGLIALEADSGLYLMDANGGPLRRIPNTLPGDGDPAWSPDGRRIAFDRPSSRGTYDIYVMNADGSGVRRLTFAPGDDSWPRWAPNGKSLVFESTRKGEKWVYAIDVRRGDARRLVKGLKPDWAQNGRIVFEGWGTHLVFSSGDLESITPYGLRHSVDARADGLEKYGFPRVSRDGRRLVVQGGRPSHLSVSNIDGRGRSSVPIGSDLRQTNAIWSPGGDWLLFTGSGSEGRELYVVRPNGVGLARITRSDDADSACCADWTA